MMRQTRGSARPSGRLFHGGLTGTRHRAGPMRAADDIFRIGAVRSRERAALILIAEPEEAQ
jgi:hypothetical protein